jgi:hypothetical protein
MPSIRSSLRRMKTIARFALIFVVFFATWMLGALASLFVPLGSFEWLGSLVGLVFAVFVTRYVWARLDDPPGTIFGYVGYGAAIVGGIGFALGFFGPMIVTPGANQGPMLGLFVTGPAGALIGALGGLVYGLSRRSER